MNFFEKNMNFFEKKWIILKKYELFWKKYELFWKKNEFFKKNYIFCGTLQVFGVGTVWVEPAAAFVIRRQVPPAQRPDGSRAVAGSQADQQNLEMEIRIIFLRQKYFIKHFIIYQTFFTH